jgi:hypothetical protein
MVHNSASHHWYVGSSKSYPTLDVIRAFTIQDGGCRGMPDVQMRYSCLMIMVGAWRLSYGVRVAACSG